MLERMAEMRGEEAGEDHIVDLHEADAHIGVVGVEMAASLKTKFTHLEVTLLHSRQPLLASKSLQIESKNKALELVAQKGDQASSWQPRYLAYHYH
jgi:hypothetical protein